MDAHLAPTTLEEALARISSLSNKLNESDKKVNNLSEELGQSGKKLAEVDKKLTESDKKLKTLSQKLAESSASSKSLQLLSEGSFGKVYHLPVQTVVFKTCHDNNKESEDQLQHEFELYSELYTSIGLLPALGSFCVPRPWHLWCPNKLEFVSPDLSPPRAGRSRPPHKDLSSSIWTNFPNPTLAVDLRSNCEVRLFRLYFGREDFGPMTTDLREGLKSDLPLDIARYNILSSKLANSLPDVEDISRGMGHLLATLHWLVGINGRDVELVLGGFGVDDAQRYALDFNQCQRWLIATPFKNPRALTPTTNITSGGYWTTRAT
ncbi:hypothetical protein CspHIS471_0401760 [Cutaneotrichosporon sp. HIS471]|nr:hypothetical protein CspHIS471_0401760 [Cutaneotrichosporon sp. HIS471]